MKTKILIAISIAAMFFAISCKTTENIVAVENPKITFMNTGYSLDGKIYSSAVFDSVTAVSVIEFESNNKREIPTGMFSYNPSSTELTISKDFALPNAELVFHIVGVPACPAKFKLNHIKGEPLVMFDKKIAVTNEDYKYSDKNNILEFIYPLDIGTQSYVICWLNSDGSTNTLGNAFEDFEEFYNAEIGKFIAAKLN